MDIELYNYCDKLFWEWRSGNLKPAGVSRKDEDDPTAHLNAGVSFQTMEMQPAGMAFKRDNADFMNNFYVDIICRSFTNIEEVQRQYKESNESNKNKASLKELESLKEHWNGELNNEASTHFNGIDQKLLEGVGGGDLSKMKNENMKEKLNNKIKSNYIEDLVDM